MDRHTLTHLQSAATIGVAALLLVLGWGGVVAWPWWSETGVEPRQWWHVVPLAVAAAGMFLKIRRPILALVLGAIAASADVAIGGSVAVVLCLTDLLYSTGIRGSGRALRIVVLVLAGIVGAAGLAASILGGGVREVLNVVMLGVAVLLTPLWWAVEVRRGRPLLSESDARERLERERHAALLEVQEARRRASVEEERRRMARELHDVLSSQLSAIALTSGGALHAGPEAGRDRRALRAIRATSVESLEQLRDMVHLLRGSPEQAPEASEGLRAIPGPADEAEAERGPRAGTPAGDGDLLTVVTWPEVLVSARSHGLDVVAPESLPDGLPQMTEGVLVRVLQESLANALKHGAGMAVVRLDEVRGGVRLRIGSPSAGEGSPPGRPEAPGVTATSSGTGLAAMRERVRLVDGRFRAGWTDGEWVVEARVPRRGTREGVDA